MSEGPEKPAFEARLQAAEDAARPARREPGRSEAGSARRAIELAMRLGVEMVAAMVIAVGIGWGLDKLLHTTPWLMILMVPVGLAAGLRNLMRAGATDDRAPRERR
ncbi:AtpZ/AtpI family protein [Acidocella sp.]|uniref:AtpZ/AtpI family protein n=1 Tax=Acidocella sp. TaxID=50710 RepID=UPI0026372C22|nr:AtpZ/AtpI family protein [Acidocella sp.]